MKKFKVGKVYQHGTFVKWSLDGNVAVFETNENNKLRIHIVEKKHL